MWKSKLALFFSFSVCTLSLSADVVEMNNGDRITGEVQSLSGGSLVIKTAYAGQIKIRFEHVHSLTTGEPVVVQFESGLQLESPVLIEEESVKIEGPPSYAVFRSEINSITRRPEPVGDVGFFENWHGDIDFGYNIARGNTTLNNLAFTVSPQRRTDADRIQTRFHTLHSVQNDQTTSNLSRARLRYDRFIGPQTFFFLLGEAERDGQQQLDFRTRQGSGFGVRFKPQPYIQLSIYGGFTFLQERFETAERKLGAEGLGGFDLETSLFGALVFTTRSQLLPFLTEERFLFQLESGIRIPLFDGLTFGFQLFDNYDSSPLRAVRKNDVGLLSTVGYSF